MAKDPAFLFYSQDWLTGTLVMSFEDRGKYITILSLMHQQGRMREETICFIVGSISVTLKSKFSIDKNGFWFNKRLEEETEKRAAYSKSRHENGKKGGRPKKTDKPYGYHMVNHMEDVIEDENESKNGKENADKKPKREKIIMPWESANFLLTWKRWKEYKAAEHKFSYKSAISEQTALNELATLSEGFEENAIKIITKSISKGWKGFFKLNDDEYDKRIIKTPAEQKSDFDRSASRYFRDE